MPSGVANGRDWISELTGFTFGNGYRVIHILPQSRYATREGINDLATDYVVIIAVKPGDDYRKESFVSVRIMRYEWLIGYRNWAGGIYSPDFPTAVMDASALVRL